jgi:hypothetical protein
VTHERLDDEVMVIHLETGAYFALEGVAADCWTVAAGGGTMSDMVDAVVARYGADAGAVRADVQTFLAELVSHGLLESGPGATTTNGAGWEVGTAAPPPAYARPVAVKYDDLEELLLFDPIHEVDEAGWPVLRHDAAG